MKKYVVLQLCIPAALIWTIVCFVPAWAGPTLSSMDGKMGTREWRGHETVEYGHSDGEYYDVERLGLYISDNILYIGLQTDFNLDGGWTIGDRRFSRDEYGEAQYPYRVDPGDFAFDFDGDGSYEAGIDFKISGQGVEFTLFEINDTDNWVDPVRHKKNSPYTAYVKDYASFQKSGSGPGRFSSVIAYEGDDDQWPGDVLEAAIDLDTLSNDLNRLFRGRDRTLNLFWTMECGNDALLASEVYSYEPAGQVPEPGTLVLMWAGLAMAAFLGRANACNPGMVFDFQWFRTLMALAWFFPRLPSVANALKSFVPGIYVR